MIACRLSSLLLVLLLLSPTVANSAAIALTEVNLADVETLSIKTNQTILVNNGRIVAVNQSGTPVPAGYVEVKLSGKFLLPGLIDAHVHHATEPEGYDNSRITRERLRKALWGGVTSVRDMGGDVRVLAGLKRGAELDLIPSPDIYYSVILGGPGFFSDPRTVASARGRVPGDTDWMRSVDANTDVAALMQRTLGTGATGIKMYADLPSDTVARLAQAAKAAGVKVWSHAFIGPDSPQSVVDAGVEVISHVPDLSAQMINDYKAWRRKGATISDAEKAQSFSEARYQQLFAGMKRQNTLLDATLTVFEKHRNSGPNRYLMFEHGKMLTKLAHQHGIKIVAGTDSIDDDAKLPLLHHELQLLVEHGGMTPAEAIQAATLHAAAAIGISDEAGSIVAGKKANLLILHSDPFANIRNSQDIAHVIKNGRFVYRGDDERLPFSSARTAGGILWLSGQIGNFPGTMTLAGADISSQMTQAMDNIMAVLQRHQLTAADVNKCTLMLVDINDWAKASEIYKSYFSGVLPARSAFAASGLALKAKVEIECMASLP